MNIVLMLIGVVVVYKILSVVYKENWDKNLSSDVSFSNKTATKGDKIDIIETVVNAKKLPVFCMNVKLQYLVTVHDIAYFAETLQEVFVVGFFVNDEDGHGKAYPCQCVEK